MWHLVCGDAAVEGVTFVLGEELARSALRVMRDDLAVGPLTDIDNPPCAARSTYWQGVWPEAVQPVPDFATELQADAHWLKTLATGQRAVTVWHGDSCSEQLLLARVAQSLSGSAIELWEVACGNPQLPPRRAVSLCRPQQLQELYGQRQLLDTSRRSELATHWQQAQQHNADIRIWHAGRFKHHEHALVDDPLLQYCSEQWQPLARVMAEVMAQSRGFYPTDFFLHWRARELARSGRLQLAQPLATVYADQQVRRLNA